jgi:DNA-binding PadR family transcriptional regulator
MDRRGMPHGPREERGGHERHRGPGPNMADFDRVGRMFFGRGRPEGGAPRGDHRGNRFFHGPHVSRGDVRSAALALLTDGPRHGYQIIQEIGERSSGTWRPSPGSVYPALQLLEDEGLIRAEQVETRRVFHLTDAGKSFVAEHKAELAAVWNSVSDTVDNSMVELRDLYEQVGVAVRQVVRAGSKQEIAGARQLLITTRRQLYRILADADAEPARSGSADKAALS